MDVYECIFCGNLDNRINHWEYCKKHPARKQIAQLQAEIKKLRKIVKSFKDNLPVNCLCDEAYKDRGLTDPNCQYCYWEEELNAIKALEGE